jgi:integrase/recombinase XerD
MTAQPGKPGGKAGRKAGGAPRRSDTATATLAPEGRRWIVTFLESKSAVEDAAPNTQMAYARDLADFAAWLGARGSDFARAGRDDVENYLIACEAAGLARATRARRLAAIRQMYRFATDEGWRPDNPAIEIRGPGRARRLPGTLTQDEVGRLLAAAHTTGRSPADRLRNTCLMELLYATGLRVTELVTLPRAAGRGDPRMILVRGKGGRERMVPLSTPARAALAAWLAHLDAQSPQPQGNRARYLFPSSSAAGHLTRVGFHGLIKDFAVAAGLSPALVTPHTLRHAFATHLLAGGADLRVIQTLLGHADVATTEIYTHILDERLKALVLEHHPLAREPGAQT